MPRANNFNSVAKIYDRLAKIVFGKALIKAQVKFLDHISHSDRVLIVGGGTGEILDHLDRLALPLKVEFLDLSEQMVRLAKDREPFYHIKVKYIVADCMNIYANEYCCDVLITNFLLDVFNEDNLKLIVSKLSDCVDQDGKWLVTDFEKKDRLWQKALLWLMYRFFRITSKLEGRELLPFNNYIESYAFKCVASSSFYRGMIKSRVYYKE